MPPTTTSARRILALLLLACGTAARAELYKCRDADGGISYQQHACRDEAGTRLALPVSPPSAGGTPQDYSVGAQLEAMQAERRQAQAARARRDAARTTRVAEPDTRDRAKCAKHRAAVAQWQARVRDGYRTQEDRDYRKHQLEYHEVLRDRYCGD